jgi:general secretion pathway protein F
MLKAGQDIDRAMLFLINDTKNARRIEVLTRLRDEICAGSSFASALSKIPGSFTALYVGLVRAGESSGILPSTLASLADLLELQQARMAKLRNALIYPTGLLLTGLGAVLILLIDVLPKFTPLFEQANVRLPMATQSAIDFGQLISANKSLLLASLASLILGFGQLRKWPRSRRTLDRVLLALPLVGPLERDVMAARFARTLGTLIIGRVPLISALALVGAATTNKAAEAAILSCLAKVKDGSGLATSLAETKLFPNRMVSLFRIGEDTAQLGETALRAADIHDERIESAIEKLMNLLPPLLILLIGGMVGAIVNALLQAMLSLNDIVS